MHILNLQKMTLTVNFEKGEIDSLILGGKERLASHLPLFKIGMRDKSGEYTVLSAYDAKNCMLTEDGAIYTAFQNAFESLSVRVYLNVQDESAAWRIAIDGIDNDTLAEWVDFPLLSLPKLADNNSEKTGGKVLFPYNEGVLVSNLNNRRHREPVYPSLGNYAIFPNMVCSQMLAYLWDDIGLYIGAHDPSRAVKGIDFFEENDATTMQIRLFCGVSFGENFETDYPIIWSVVGSNWESAAEKYRTWFEAALPPRAKKIAENPDLPEWYKDSPLIVSYPVRGVHDMDTMTPNAYYPYTNALPMIEELNKEIDSRIMVLLMHWEGTAPWAPPYVWPPFGDEKDFIEFQNKLHAKKNLLGVYCSGFGYTIQSNLIEDYNKQAEYDENGLSDGMCAGANGQVAISKICTGQRSGYDICPASPVGRKLLDKAYQPLFESGLDYVQILDQNHGGGQYFCYSENHGHPPAPGAWMTQNMQQMLSDWNKKAPSKLFGCESAAAEPFIGNLQFSDNRFELNYAFGRPVPLYAYLYHEYLRNFMGNQVACGFQAGVDTLPYRIAYSFAAGDAMTIVLNPEGNILSYWGQRDFSKLPNKKNVLQLIKNLTGFYKEQASPYLFSGRMIESPQIDCETVTYPTGKRDLIYQVEFPAVHATAWEFNGKRVLILVNPQVKPITCKVSDKEIRVPPLDAMLINLP